MKKLLLAASVAFLAACSAPQQPQLNLMPQATLSSSAMVQGKTYSLSSTDIRTAQYVALVDSGRANVQPLHSQQNLRITLENLLSQQFQSQGYSVNVNSDNTIELEIQETLVNVKHSVMSNDMEATVILAVTAETPQGKLVKTFNGTAKRSGTFAATDPEIEAVLNDVINLVFKEIANDQELQSYMKERF